MIGVRRQTQIYLDGVSGRRPSIPLDPDRLEAAAQKRMRPAAFAYVAAASSRPLARSHRDDGGDILSPRTGR